MKQITFFQASNLSDEEVIDQFVARRKELNQILGEIRQDDMTASIQHYILIGQRGSGKSTLLRRIQAAVNTEPNLKERLVAVNLSEEQAGIYRLHDLWDRVCDELQVKGIPVQEVNWEAFDGDLTAYARALYDSMQQGLKKADRKLVLLIDNIDRVLENIREDNHLFRELLMNHKDLRIIGGSTRLSEHHWKYDEPFYQFFQVIRLQPLTEAEMKELLLYWADFMNEPKLKRFIEEGTGKLNAVRILSDGMPRTMLHLLDLLINRPEEHGYEYLRHIIDRATPIYQERLGTLSTHQQKIVLELSFFWEAAPVKDLANAAKMDSKTVSAALNKLVELQIVQKRKGTGKNMLYLLKERFFNLWLIMTQGGPRQKSRVKWLTVFLETWYGPDELKTIYVDFNQRLASGKLTADQAVVMTKALVHRKWLSITERDHLLHNAKQVIGGNRDYLDILPQTAKDMFNEVVQLMKDMKWQKALQVLNDIEQEDAVKNAIKGFVYVALDDTISAEKEYLLAEEKGLTKALDLLGDLYRATNRPDKAESYYLRAIEAGESEALESLAMLYVKLDRIEEAESCFLRSINSGNKHSSHNLATLYYDTNRFEPAEHYYLQSIATGYDSSLHNLAHLYRKTKRIEEAKQYYLKAIDKQIPGALNNLASLYDDLNQHEKAEEYFIMALDKKEEAGISLGMFYYQSQVSLSKATNHFKKYLLKEPKGISNYNKLFRLVLGVWTGHPEVLDNSTPIIQEELASNDTSSLMLFLRDLLIHHQQNTVWDYFKHPTFGAELRKRQTPIYFATAKLLDNAEVVTTMPPELAEPVAGVLEEVKQGREEYYGNHNVER